MTWDQFKTSQLDALERAFLLQTWQECAYNQAAAARRLGITRVGLIKKFARLGIVRPDGENSTTHSEQFTTHSA